MKRSITSRLASLAWSPAPVKGILLAAVLVAAGGGTMLYRLWNLTHGQPGRQIKLPCRRLGDLRWTLDSTPSGWLLTDGDGGERLLAPGEPFAAGNALLHIEDGRQLVLDALRFGSDELDQSATLGWARACDITFDDLSVPLKAGELSHDSNGFHFEDSLLADKQELALGEVRLVVEIRGDELTLRFHPDRQDRPSWLLRGGRHLLTGPVNDPDLGLDQHLLDWQFLEEVKSLCENGALTVADGRVALRRASDLDRLSALRLGWIIGLENRTAALSHFVTGDSGRLLGLRPEVVKIPNPCRNPHGRVRGSILDRHGRPLAFSKLVNGQATRRWPAGRAAAHAVGTCYPGMQATGLESCCDGQLARGQDVTTTLSTEWQRIAWEELSSTVSATPESHGRGAAVVMDARTGALWAAVSLPAFDPNSADSVRAACEGRGDGPLLNRAFHGLYAPGSTFKIVTAAALLESEVRDFHVVCSALGTKVAGRTRPIRCWASRYGGHGDLGLADTEIAFMLSCNTFFMNVPLAMGRTGRNDRHRPEPFLRWVERFGLTAWPADDRGANSASPPTAGVPTVYGRYPAASKWTAGTGRRALNDADLAALGFGQGELLASPLAVALWTAVVCSDGHLPQPHLVKGDSSHAAPRRIIGSSTAAHLRRMMTLVTGQKTWHGQLVRGTAYNAFFRSGLPFAVAGKTGTAEVGGGRKPHAWFTCFAPAENPRVVITVLVEHGQHGHGPSATVARGILLRMADRLK